MVGSYRNFNCNFIRILFHPVAEDLETFKSPEFVDKC
jgi:hypothetical protein